MHLAERLENKRRAIVGRWSELALSVYPEDSTHFLRDENDRFRNPVGHAIRDGLERLFDGLVQARGPKSTAKALDEILRVRAVQELDPSQAVGFLLGLKRIVRDELPVVAPLDPATASDLAELDDRIDRLALDGFDLYVCCREKVYELRLGEIKRNTSTVPLRADRKGPAANGGCGA